MTACTIIGNGHAYGQARSLCPICREAPLDASDANPAEPATPRLTNARARELLAELSLIDLCRLALTKATGPDGLTGGAMTLESDDVAIVIRSIRKKKPSAKTSSRR